MVPAESVKVRPAPTSEYSHRVVHGLVGIRSLVFPPGLQAPNPRVFTDIRLMDGFDNTPPTSYFPSPLDTAEAQVMEASD